jgi:hypothetical protein
MTKVFYGCCAVFPTYGKDEEQLTDALQMFNMCLHDYTAEQIKGAFLAWMKSNKQFPTPADIINLIERGNKPAFDRAVYTSISKKQPEDRIDEEWEYMKDFEKFQILGKF